MRELGIDIEGRVARILTGRGVAGVIEEVNLVHSDHIKRKYLSPACGTHYSHYRRSRSRCDVGQEDILRP